MPGTTPHLRDATIADVLEYWRCAELFGPRTVPAPDPDNPGAPVVAWRQGRRLPWDMLARPAPRDGTQMAWQHTVYLGEFDLEAIYAHLLRASSPQGGPQLRYRECRGGVGAVAAIVVSDDGRVLAGSEQLSSAAWAVGRTAVPNPGTPDWFEGYQRAWASFSEAIRNTVASARRVRGYTNEPRVDADLLLRLLGRAQLHAGVRTLDGMNAPRIVIASRPVPAHLAQLPPQRDVLNSPFAADLAILTDQDWGPALSGLLLPQAAASTTSGQAHVTGPAGASAASGDAEPAGTISDPGAARGCGNEDHSDAAGHDAAPPAPGPAAPQDAAGPAAPVSRVDVRTDPAALPAATGRQIPSGGRWPGSSRPPSATSEQAAVEYARSARGGGLAAVTVPAGTDAEHVLLDVIADDLTERAHVLAALDTPDDAFTGPERTWQAAGGTHRVRALREELAGFEFVLVSHDAATARECEGLAAQVNQRLWPAPARAGRGVQAVLAATGTHPGPHLPSGLTAWLAAQVPGTASSGLRGWGAARASFTAAARRVDELRAQRGRAAARIEQRHRLEGRIATAEATVHQLTAELGSRASTLTDADSELAACAAQVRAAEARLAAHSAARPGTGSAILTAGLAGRSWRSERDELSRILASAVTRRDAAAAARELAQEAWDAAERERAAGLDALGELRRQAAELRERLDADAAAYGPAYPGPAWRAGERARELNAAWADPVLDEAREALLDAALDLHRAFCRHSRDARAYLTGALEVAAGRAPADLHPDDLAAAWRMLFLAIPVRHLPASEVPARFSGLGCEALGTVVIPAAERMAPQMALGAAWRARRVLTLGDCLLPGPVSTLSRRSQQDLAIAWGVDPRWAPADASVGALADRAARLGTNVHVSGQHRWLSLPLRVDRAHRSPMPQIAAALSEDLVVSEPSRAGHPADELAASAWLDVPARTPATDVQPGELDALAAHLSQTLASGVNPADVLVIAPLRPVARAARTITGLPAEVRVRTVSEAAGAEAEVVYLVLGGDPRRAAAQVWATDGPARWILAVTRARRRLYVIGDLEAWAGHPHVATIAGFFHAPPGGGTGCSGDPAGTDAAGAVTGGGEGTGSPDPAGRARTGH